MTDGFRARLLRPLMVLAIASLLVLAGCAGKATKATAVSQPTASVSDSTGAIQGMVLADDEAPIMGAQVGLDGLDLEPFTTDASGYFVFGDLEPGTYTIIVSALGYESANKDVEVVANDVAEATFKLEPRALEGVAYNRVFGPINSKFFCAFSAGLSGPCKGVAWEDPNHPVESAWAGVSGGENNIFDYPTIISGNRSVKSDVLSTVVVEVTWQSVHASSKWLQSTLEMRAAEDEGRNISAIDYGYAKGSSPLKIVSTPGIKGELADQALTGAEEGFTVGVFPTPDPAGPQVPNPTNGRTITVGASAYTEQTFQVWITLFYNGAAGADYSALA